MVDRKGKLVAVPGQLKAWADQPGIVDQHIDPLVFCQQGFGQLAHRGEAGEIGERSLDPVRAGTLGDEAPRPLGARRIAADHDDLHALPRQTERGVESDAGRRAGDDRDPLARRDHRGSSPFDLMIGAASKPARKSISALAGAGCALAAGIPAK